MGGGRVGTLPSCWLGPGKRIVPAGHRRRTISIPRNIVSLRVAYCSGCSTKSLGCQPAANEIPTRPPEMLSTTDHSSAIRMGLCNGDTQLPARRPIDFVIDARAALVTEGFAYNPPNSPTCR